MVFVVSYGVAVGVFRRVMDSGSRRSVLYARGRAWLEASLQGHYVRLRLVPYALLSLLLFGGTTYISLDVALGITETLGGLSNPPERLKSIPLFVLLNIWPAATAVVFLLLMTFIVLKVLNETRPMWYYVLSGALFVLAQLAWFLLGRVVCRGSNERVDGSFIATILETASVCALYLGWRSITEESWDDAPYPTGYAQPYVVYGR
ncbi:chitin synthase III catalytic subunit-domain-containing protein [Cyathus striatus]|nr:chitin synthase III catalytic subunit-domain-containing protein [Cyathus striatus]